MTTLRSIAILTLSITLLAVPALGAEDAATVEAVDWVTVADASLFEETAVTGVAVGPGGEAVIVGFDVERTIHRDGIGLRAEGPVWWSRDGSEWRSGTFPDPEGARPARVIATPDGFVATGSFMDAEEASHGVIWTTTDGSEWSPQAFEGAVFTDLDSVGDRVVVAGEQGATPTVWTSRAGGPWQSVTIVPGGPRFTADQIALSADGVYLVLDQRTGELYRSDDGTGFRPVDLPDVLGGADLAAIGSGYVDMKPGEAVGLSLTGDPTGFHLMVQHDGADALTAWASPDGLMWRPEVSLPGSLWYLGGGDRGAFYSGSSGSDLAFLQTDGTWCTVPSPVASPDDAWILGMAWNDDGDMLVHGTPERYGDPVIWQATGVRCGGGAA